MPHWIDAHCHLADPRLAADLDGVIARSRAAGVQGWVQGGVSPRDWKRQSELRRIHGPRFVTSFGLHPWEASLMTEARISEALKELASCLPEAHALGETGLDHSPRFTARERSSQRLAFESQLDLLSAVPKPLILHVVQAHGEALEILRKRAPFPRGGLVHSFSASIEVAREYLKLGFSLSISAAVAKRGFQNLKSALSSLPLDKILVETDSPDQSLVRGQLNEPAHLPEIAGAIAKLLLPSRGGMSAEAVLDQSTKNALQLFGLEL